MESCTSLARPLKEYVPGAPWEDQRPACSLLHDTSPAHEATVDKILAANGVFLLHLTPYCPNFSALKPVFPDSQRSVRHLPYHRHDLPDRMNHVLAFASIPLARIQGDDTGGRYSIARIGLQNPACHSILSRRERNFETALRSS